MRGREIWVSISIILLISFIFACGTLHTIDTLKENDLICDYHGIIYSKYEDSSGLSASYYFVVNVNGTMYVDNVQMDDYLLKCVGEPHSFRRIDFRHKYRTEE